MPGRLCIGQQLRWNGLDADRLAAGSIKVIRLLSDQVDHALERRLATDRKLHEASVATQLCAQLLDYLFRVRPDAVHLVDESQSRNVVAPHLAINRQRLGLDAADRAKNQHGAVEDAQASLNLDGKIDMAGRVDQVDRGVAPFDRCGGAGNRDAAFAFKFHVVHRGAAAGLVMYLLHAVDAAGIVQDRAR